MASGPNAVPTLRLSSADFPGRDGLAMWRELVGRKMLRLDMQPLEDAPPRFELKLLKPPGLGIMAGDIGPARFTRTRALMADGNDDIAAIASAIKDDRAILAGTAGAGWTFPGPATVVCAEMSRVPAAIAKRMVESKR